MKEQKSCCKYCGQIILVQTDEEDEDKLIELATAKCKCDGAKYYQKKSSAKNKIAELFNGYPAVVELLTAAVEQIEMLEKVTVSIENVKCEVSLTAKGFIKISRKESRQRSAEI